MIKAIFFDAAGTLFHLPKSVGEHYAAVAREQGVEIAPFFDHVFISSQLGADKPDAEIYRRALVMSGFMADEAMYVGDDPERDWKGASAAGLRIFKLDRCKNSLRDLSRILAPERGALRRGPR